MKEIMKEYGGAMFTAAVVISVLTIIFSAVTDSDDTEGIDYNAYIDYGAYQSEIAKDAPTIEYQGTGSLVLGTVQVADYVKAHDYNGQELAVKLLKFCDSDGNELPDQMDAAAGTITFHTAGIYSFTVKATDSGNRKTTAVIHVPVM